MDREQLSLEELSAAIGMTARNVRAYQTKGLIPPPVRAGRRSVYSSDHLHRLQAIERARQQGASLALIATHLAAGRTLDDDTLVGWSRMPPAAPSERRAGADDSRATTEAAGMPRAPASRDIAPLLARLDIQRDAAAQAHVEQLVAAGVFRPEGGRIYTGRDLAEALLELQRHGMPLNAALGIAERALQAAATVAAVLHEALRCAPGGGSLEESAVTRGPLGEVACYMLRHLCTQQERDASRR